MADLEPQVCAILEIMVNAAVSEMNKVIGASDPPRPQETSCVAEDTHGSPEDKVQDKVVYGRQVSGPVLVPALVPVSPEPTLPPTVVQTTGRA